jgi:hypothetical protein
MPKGSVSEKSERHWKDEQDHERPPERRAMNPSPREKVEKGERHKKGIHNQPDQERESKDDRKVKVPAAYRRTQKRNGRQHDKALVGISVTAYM